METIEITASSKDEALNKAASSLGVPAEQIKITVLEESKGLFGKPGKVKVKAEVVAPKVSKSKAKAKVEDTPATTGAEADPVAVEPAPVEEAPKSKPARKAAKPEKAEKAEPVAKAVTDTPAEAKEEVVATEADADALKGILDKLLGLADMEAEVKVTDIKGRYISMQIDGDDVGYLVGRRGEVLNALQYLCNVISSRKVANGVRVTLEGDDYRHRREAILTQMALEVAEEVKKRGEEAVLAPLPAFERRIIHQALVDFDGVETYSEGEEPDRRVVIGPRA